MASLNEANLVGKWVSDPSHGPTMSGVGDVTLEFYPDGKLNYVVHNLDGDQVIFLTYIIEGEYLITDQKSKPQKEKTKGLIENGKLKLYFNGEESNFVKVLQN